MKKAFLLLLLAGAAGTLLSVAQNNPPYVIPMAADGTFVKDGSDYTDKVQMTATDDGYVVNNVTLNGGLLFLGADKSGVYSTLYGMPGWAVSPALISYPNPLLIIGSESGYIPVEDGEYNIHFFDRESTGQSYHLFSIVPSDNPTEVVYPPSVYLISGNSTIEVPGSDGDYWVYTSLPSQFKISYEPRDMATFEFGAASATGTALVAHTPVDIALGENTGTAFTYAATGGLKSGMNAIVKVNLVDNTLNIDERVPTGVDDIEADADQVILNGNTVTVSGTSTKTIYDITGKQVLNSREDVVSRTLPAGMYIVRTGDTVKKIIVGRY